MRHRADGETWRRGQAARRRPEPDSRNEFPGTRALGVDRPQSHQEPRIHRVGRRWNPSHRCDDAAKRHRKKSRRRTHRSSAPRSHAAHRPPADSDPRNARRQPGSRGSGSRAACDRDRGRRAHAGHWTRWGSLDRSHRILRRNVFNHASAPKRCLSKWRSRPGRRDRDGASRKPRDAVETTP